MHICIISHVHMHAAERQVGQLAAGGEAWAGEEARARHAVETALRNQQSVVIRGSHNACIRTCACIV